MFFCCTKFYRNKGCPIFVKFPLLTSKNIDFQDFYKALLIKDKQKLSKKDIEKIISLKNSMNSKRKIFKNISSNFQTKINHEWFIGFIEGEGTLGIRTGSTNSSKKILVYIV